MKIISDATSIRIVGAKGSLSIDKSKLPMQLKKEKDAGLIATSFEFVESCLKPINLELFGLSKVAQGFLLQTSILLHANPDKAISKVRRKLLVEFLKNPSTPIIQESFWLRQTKVISPLLLGNSTIVIRIKGGCQFGIGVTKRVGVFEDLLVTDMGFNNAKTPCVVHNDTPAITANEYPDLGGSLVLVISKHTEFEQFSNGNQFRKVGLFEQSLNSITAERKILQEYETLDDVYDEKLFFINNAGQLYIGDAMSCYIDMSKEFTRFRLHKYRRD